MFFLQFIYAVIFHLFFQEIPPYETKPIIKANFIARIEKNHTAFIRIRTNSSEQDYLLLPVEVDVSSGNYF